MEGGEAKFNGRDWNTTPPGLVPVWIEGISKEKCRNLKRSKGSRCELLEWRNDLPVESCSRLAISQEIKHPLESLVFFFTYVQGSHVRRIEEKKNKSSTLSRRRKHVPPLLISKLLSCVWATNWRSLALAAPQRYVAVLMLLSPLLRARKFAWLLHYDWLDI